MWNPRICRTNLGAWASLREFWPPWEVWEPIPYDTEPTVISVCRKHRIQVQSLGTQMGRIDSPELMYHQGPLTCIKKIGIIFVFALFYFSLHSLAKKVKALKMKCQERFFSPLPVLKWSWGIAAAAKSLQSCLTLWRHRWQPTRLPYPWDSPGKIKEVMNWKKWWIDTLQRNKSLVK